MSAQHTKALSSCLRLGRKMRERRALAVRRAAEAEALRLSKLPPRSLLLRMSNPLLFDVLDWTHRIREIGRIGKLGIGDGCSPSKWHRPAHDWGLDVLLDVPQHFARHARLDMIRAERDVIEATWKDKQ